MATFGFWLKSFWLWFSFSLLWKRGPTVEYSQPFSLKPLTTMVYWVLEIGFLPRFKCQLLCQVAFHYARRHSKKSSLPIAIIPPRWRAVIQQLFSFSHLNSTEIIWFHISANQCGEKIIALVRVGRPSSFGDKLELRGLSATKIEPSGGGSSFKWNH